MLNDGVEGEYGFFAKALGFDWVKEAASAVHALASAEVPVTHPTSREAIMELTMAEVGVMLRLAGIATVATSAVIAVTSRW